MLRGQLLLLDGVRAPASGVLPSHMLSRADSGCHWSPLLSVSHSHSLVWTWQSGGMREVVGATSSAQRAASES